MGSDPQMKLRMWTTVPLTHKLIAAFVVGQLVGAFSALAFSANFAGVAALAAFSLVGILWAVEYA